MKLIISFLVPSPLDFLHSVQKQIFRYGPRSLMTQFINAEGAGLYLNLLVLDGFVLGIVFWITYSVYISFLLLSELDLGLLRDMRWITF